MSIIHSQDKKFRSISDAYNFIGDKGFKIDVKGNGYIYISRLISYTGNSVNRYVHTNLPRNRKIVQRHLTILVVGENIHYVHDQVSEHSTCNFSIFYLHGAIFTASVIYADHVRGDPGDLFEPNNSAEKILFEDIQNGKIVPEIY